MSSRNCLTLLLAAAASSVALGADPVSFTYPVGFNKVTCLNNSDTIVGVPLKTSGSRQDILNGDPVIDGGDPDVATLTLSNGNLTAGTLTKHYVKFTIGTKNGRFYDITSNTENTVTLDLNGDDLIGVVDGNTLGIIEHWTLDTLFPPAEATTSWTETPASSGNFVPNGHAIVASTNTLPTGRRTEIRLPNVAAAGTNIPAEGRYYIHNGIWKRSGSGSSDFGELLLYPDTLLTISNPPSVAHPTTYIIFGDVELGSLAIPLATQESISQDNFIAIPRPVNVTLDELNLRQSPGAFLASTNTLPTGRRDQLLVFDNDLQLRNKAPSKTYYVHGGIWKLSGGGSTNRGSEAIPPSAGFIIRKYKITGQPTAFWLNSPSY